MSRWTHIIGAIHIDTLEEKKDIKRYIETKITKAPKITGSEGNASIFVNLEEGYNISSWDNEYYQSRAIITIQGDLRDKDGTTTKKETQKFIKYILKKLDWEIRVLSITIEDECSQEESFTFFNLKDFE